MEQHEWVITGINKMGVNVHVDYWCTVCKAKKHQTMYHPSPTVAKKHAHPGHRRLEVAQSVGD